VSLIPAFELGLWNAWILIFPMIIVSIFGSRILGKRASEEVSSIPKRARTASNLYFPIVLLSYAYSVFLPLKLATIWFVVGFLIYLPVMFFLIIVLSNFASTSVAEPVTKGVYSISRNPMYVGDFLVNISIGIACLSWVFLLVAIVNFCLLRWYVVVVEEPFLLEKYGDTYRDYMNRTPRWIGLPKSKK
jgi:protein-S-isoprenylcysteine O-methyltransferase Ste14